MTLQDELTLSYYRRISKLDAAHNVWLVRHEQTGRLGVEKHPSVYDLAVYRQLMAQPVPRTPRIYAAVEDADGLTVIEEYISGTPLSQLLERGPLPEHIAAHYTRQLCRIVAALHACAPPIIHRDIKPSNILIADDGTLTLLDFDAAKSYRGAADHDTRLIGTAGYAAPEQYGFAASGPRTDQYAIGVLMATMVYGAFSRSALTARRYDRIIERCTRIDPADRYPGVMSIVAELDGNFHTEPSRAAPSPAEAPPQREIPWLPPGFRSLRWQFMLPMAIWYLLALGSGMRVAVEGADAAATAVYRLFATLGLIAGTFFLGNYLDVWSRFGITKLRAPWLRWLAAAVGAFLILVLLLAVASVISQFL